MRRLALILVLLASQLAIAQSDSNSINLTEAARYFAETQRFSARDAGKLWGKSLYGPILFVDPTTRVVVANQADAEGELQQQNSMWVGRLPREMPIANTAVQWAGARWTMLIWPVPKDRQGRQLLVLHECFHRIQPDIGVETTNALARHLDSTNGRIWLRMEWRALIRALESQGTSRKQAIADALMFRERRLQLAGAMRNDAAQSENGLLMNEGLAEYTAIRLAAANQLDALLLACTEAKNYDRKSSGYARSFAYASGPLYGLLLDAAHPDWRTRLKPNSDLPSLLASAYDIKNGGLSARKKLLLARRHTTETKSFGSKLRMLQSFRHEFQRFEGSFSRTPCSRCR